MTSVEIGFFNIQVDDISKKAWKTENRYVEWYKERDSSPNPPKSGHHKWISPKNVNWHGYFNLHKKYA